MTKIYLAHLNKKIDFVDENFGNLKERILKQLQYFEVLYANLTKEQRDLEAKIGSLKTEKGSYQLKNIRGYGPYLYFVTSDGKWQYCGRASKYHNGIWEKQKEARKLYNRLKQVIREKRQIIKAMQKATEILQGW